MQEKEPIPASDEEMEDDIEQAVERSYGRKIVAPLKKDDQSQKDDR